MTIKGDKNMDENLMEKEWDQRAKQDAVLYVADAARGDDFFPDGARQVKFLTQPLFTKEKFDPSGKRVLDIGCGIGRMDRGLAEMFAEVWGLDVSGEMINQAKELNRDFPAIHFVKGNGQDLHDFTDGYFSFVFSYITFQHIPKKKIIKKYFVEINRVLKTGGLFQVLLRRPWSGVAMAFGFIPVPRVIMRYIPGFLYKLYDLLAYRGDKKPYRGTTYRGTGISEKEAVRSLRALRFSKIEILPDPSGTTYWVTGKK
jgi:ubiquinone/menaquinone biosynthesis C-methylase UbiE